MKKTLPRKSLLGYAFIFVMIAASLLLHNKEVILPEMGALAVGSFIHEHPGWLAKPFHLFLLPSITAVCGFLINQMEINLAVKIILAVILVVIVLLLFKSSLAPALATALLPIITNTTSIYFIISILSFTFLLFICLKLKRGVEQQSLELKQQKMQDSLLYTAFILAWVSICWMNNWMFIAAIPPVLVVGYESVHKAGYPLKMFYKQLICLSLAAFIGIQSLYHFHQLLLAAVFDIIAVTLLLRLVAFKLTPAYAMSLLPMVLPGAAHPYFHWQVLLMSIIFLGGIYTYKNFRVPEKWTKAV